MRQFESHGPRARGPAVVWAGLDRGPALVVVDPAGEARHATLPATWRPLAERFQVAWCRVPASGGALWDVEDVLETLAQEQVQADLVASGTVSDAAIALAAQFGATVRSVLLVDPGPGERNSPTLSSDRGVAAGRMRIRVVARSVRDHRNRVEPPMPLGHPDVVGGVLTALAETDQQSTI
ncbi:hypothetical protein LWC34_29680 [Kibdelosporangium philippinense]|uniref:Uncharacterized protein n=1 Tax=Kibdelosporangium philippinense TaxID=211113 RepID=A0ABS8ZGL0_9PSEU|nr:hypothetical protein [Kibdelosporangium philippinense]MCE7006968.1 hypothetical protein [Kibdelosporangium philippinense]